MKKIILILIVGFTASALHAQNPDSITIDDYYVDFAVPDITAFSILDINSSDVVRPGNIKELAVGLQNYIDAEGNLKPGLAIEIAPYRLMAKALKVRSAWEQNKSLKNLQISIGTAQGDSSNLLAAWGINWTPVDRTDPVASRRLQNFFANYLANRDSIVNQNSFAGQRNKHLRDVNQYLNTLSTSTGPLSPATRVTILQYFGGGYKARLLRYDSTDNQLYAMALEDSVLRNMTALHINLNDSQAQTLSTLVAQNAKFTFAELKEEKEFEKGFSEALKREKKIFVEENWNRLVVQFKVGSKYNSAENSIQDLALLNWRLFGGIAGRVPGLANSNSVFAKRSQVIYQVSYMKYKDNALLNWEFSTGGRLLLGRADKRLSAEFLYSQASLKGETTEKIEYIRYTIGGEMKIDEGLWLELAVGGQKFLEGNDDARVVPQFGIKYAIQKKSRF